ncbi:MAG: DinB family protein [Bacteroidota bacterium]|nr:DinB family protein [Candidatus Kapabacteria bacterium]MDW8220075.1 DinB family protein [Bacteroidota bacterium]
MNIQEPFSSVPASIDEALDEANYIRSCILSEAYCPHSPTPQHGRWSLEDNLYHLHLVERGAASAIRRMIEGHKQERFADEAVARTWKQMKHAILNRSTTMHAPESVAPRNTPPSSACISLLGESRERLLVHCSRTTTEDLLRTSFPHPVFGQLPGLLWITFIALHEARHLEQIRELYT